MSESELGSGLPGVEHISPFILPAVWCFVLTVDWFMLQEVRPHARSRWFCVWLSHPNLFQPLIYYFYVFLFLRTENGPRFSTKTIFFNKKKNALKTQPVENGNFRLAPSIDQTGFVRYSQPFQDLHFLCSLRSAGQRVWVLQLSTFWPMWHGKDPSRKVRSPGNFLCPQDSYWNLLINTLNWI